MKKLLVVLGLLVLLPGVAAADSVLCPDPATGYTRQYAVDPALNCVFGNGTLNGAGNDAFLDLTTPFGYDWTFVKSSGGWFGSSTPFVPIPGLSITNPTDTSFNWEIEPTLWNTGLFALGIKDGGNPKWAVFLLDGQSGTGGMTSDGGSISHVALYMTPTTQVPEPASMLLLGAGLLGLAGFVRRRR